MCFITGAGDVVWDNDHPYQACATMISEAARPQVEKKPVALLHLNRATPGVKTVQDALEEAGHDISLVAFGDNISLDRDMIALLELEAPFM